MPVVANGFEKITIVAIQKVIGEIADTSVDMVKAVVELSIVDADFVCNNFVINLEIVVVTY